MLELHTPLSLKSDQLLSIGVVTYLLTEHGRSAHLQPGVSALITASGGVLSDISFRQRMHGHVFLARLTRDMESPLRSTMPVRLVFSLGLTQSSSVLIDTICMSPHLGCCGAVTGVAVLSGICQYKLSA